MVDSISIIGPGWRATNSSGQIITDGVLEFFDAGTSNARTVYSDSSLSTPLGTEVSCNSGGYPVTSGNVRTLIYTGATAYKVQLTSDIVGGVVWSHDNVLGALDTTGFLTEAAVADQSIVNISANRSITTADKGKLINGNCSSGSLTMTLADAATLEDGFFVGIRHDGTANQILITGDGTDTFGIPGASVTGFSLIGRGQTVWVVCEGTNFQVHSEMPPLINATNGVIIIADRLSAPPGSATPGARYIVGSAPSGAWSGFAEHDIAEADGFGNWFKRTPATDCGWLAYVQDEDAYVSYVGSAWAPFALGTNSATAVTSVVPADEIMVQLAGGGAMRKATASQLRSTQEAAIATTSGTAATFGSLPAGLSRITIAFDQVSLSGTDDLLVQLGDSGGFETTNYLSHNANIPTGGGSITGGTATNGFRITGNEAARAFNGHMILTRITGNLWAASWNVASSAGTVMSVVGGGRKELSAELTQIRVTRTGTDTLDSGQMNIFTE